MAICLLEGLLKPVASSAQPGDRLRVITTPDCSAEEAQGRNRESLYSTEWAVKITTEVLRVASVFGHTRRGSRRRGIMRFVVGYLLLVLLVPGCVLASPSISSSALATVPPLPHPRHCPAWKPDPRKRGHAGVPRS